MKMEYQKIVFPAIVFAAFLFFAFQTVQAFGIVAFHADFFKKKGTVVIDAGHGGEDGGAVGVNGVYGKGYQSSHCLESAEIFTRKQF